MKDEGIITKREDIHEAVVDLDTDGVERRKERNLVRQRYYNSGLNYVSYIDGCNKMKPFGFSIHGFIYGCSQKHVWLAFFSSNKIPEIISHNSTLKM